MPEILHNMLSKLGKWDFNAFVSKYADDACKGVLMAIALSGPIMVGAAFNVITFSAFASFGAMFAMFSAPKQGAKMLALSVLAGSLLVICAAGAGLLLAHERDLALLLLFLMSWLAALPRPDQAYIGFVIKFATVALLITFFDFQPPPGMASYFLAGVLFGIFLSLAASGFEKMGKASPVDELRDFFHGVTNNRYFGIAVPVTVVLSTLLAQRLSFSNPAWVGLTVLFVMRCDGTSLKRIGQRTLGTIGGVIVSFIIIPYVKNPLQLDLIIAFATFFMPFVFKHYTLFSFIITCMVLLLLDIVMLSSGGDIQYIYWRLLDTIIACACVLVPNTILRIIEKRRDKSVAHP